MNLKPKEGLFLKVKKVGNQIKSTLTTKKMQSISVILPILATLSGFVFGNNSLRNDIKKNEEVLNLMVTLRQGRTTRLTLQEISVAKPLQTQLDLDKKNPEIGNFIEKLNKKKIYVFTMNTKSWSKIPFERPTQRFILMEPGSLWNISPKLRYKRFRIMYYKVVSFHAKTENNINDIVKKEKKIRKYIKKKKEIDLFWTHIKRALSHGYKPKKLELLVHKFPERLPASRLLNPIENVTSCYFSDLEEYALQRELTELKPICPVFFSKKLAESIFESMIEEGFEDAKTLLRDAPIAQLLQLDNIRSARIREIGLGDFVQFFTILQEQSNLYKSVDFLFVDPYSIRKLGFNHYQKSLSILRKASTN